MYFETSLRRFMNLLYQANDDSHTPDISSQRIKGNKPNERKKEKKHLQVLCYLCI